MKTLLLGNKHACNDSVPERGMMYPTCFMSLSVVNMYTKVISRSKQVAVVVTKPDGHSDHYHQGH